MEKSFKVFFANPCFLSSRFLGSMSVSISGENFWKKHSKVDFHFQFNLKIFQKQQTKNNISAESIE